VNFNPKEDSSVLITAMLWKKSGERFTTSDLDFSEKIKVDGKSGQVIYRNDKKEIEISFD